MAERLFSTSEGGVHSLFITHYDCTLQLQRLRLYYTLHFCVYRCSDWVSMSRSWVVRWSGWEVTWCRWRRGTHVSCWRQRRERRIYATDWPRQRTALSVLPRVLTGLSKLLFWCFSLNIDSQWVNEDHFSALNKYWLVRTHIKIFCNTFTQYWVK